MSDAGSGGPSHPDGEPPSQWTPTSPPPPPPPGGDSRQQGYPAGQGQTTQPFAGGPSHAGQDDPGQYGTGQYGTGQYGTGQYGTGQYASYPPPPAYPGGGYDTGEASGKTGLSGFALASLLTGLLLPLIGILIALPLGIVALVKISNSRQTGRWMAITGIAISALWWVAIIALGVYVVSQEAERNDAGEIVEAGTIAIDDIRAGDCLQIDHLSEPGEATDSDFEGVPCSEGHNAESAGIISMDPQPYPGDATLRREASPQCARMIRADFAGSDPSAYQPFLLYPNEDAWDSDSSNEVLCLVVRKDYADFTEQALS